MQRKNNRVILVIGSRLELLYPSLALELKKAGSQESAKEYLGKHFLRTCLMILALFGIGYFINNYTPIYLPWIAIIVIVGIFTLHTLFIITQLPKTVVQKRVRNIETNLLDAIRSLSVEINAGVTLYDAIRNVAKGDYGELSKEFDKVVNMIESGEKEEDALEKILIYNPSFKFQQSIRPIIDSIRSGGNIGKTLKSIRKEIQDMQLNEINQYGMRLNAFIIFYTVIAVMLPALGSTFLTIMISFMNLPIFAVYAAYLLLLLATIFFNILFIGIMKSLRPNVSRD